MSAVIHRAWEVNSGALKWSLTYIYVLWIIIKAIGHEYTERKYRLVREEESEQKPGGEGGGGEVKSTQEKTWRNIFRGPGGWEIIY